MQRHLADLRKEWLVYVMIMPVVAFYIIFEYVPMLGIALAFKNYMPLRGFWDSPWVGLLHFENLFKSPDFLQVLANTILISLYRLIFGFPAPILLALLLNEVRHIAFKKIVQTISYLPHFLSWVIVGGLITTMLALEGPVNQIAATLGGEKTQYLTDPSHIRTLLVGTGVWKEIGWGTLIYLAAIAGIDPGLYEAAVIDGASRLRQTWHVTLPSIKGTVIILLILNVGGILNAGFEQIFLLQNAMTNRVTEIIDTYVYKIGIMNANYSFGTAVGIFKSAVGMLLIFLVNAIARKLGEDGLW